MAAFEQTAGVDVSVGLAKRSDLARKPAPTSANPPRKTVEGSQRAAAMAALQEKTKDANRV